MASKENKDKTRFQKHVSADAIQLMIALNNSVKRQVLPLMIFAALKADMKKAEEVKAAKLTGLNRFMIEHPGKFDR